MNASAKNDETSRHRLFELEPAPIACRIGKSIFPLTTYAAASTAYCAARDATGSTSSGETGPAAPPCEIIDANGNCIAFISYNGKVWKGPLGNENYDCLFNPYAIAGKAVEIDWRQS